MKLCALINPESGSTPGDSEGQLQAALREVGESASIYPATSGNLREAIEHALEASPDALIVWGGDGSVACALSASGPDGPPVLALPGGTMNLVHKRLHGDLTDWKDILHKALAAPRAESFAAGCVGDHDFYVAAMVGQVTSLVESREAARHGQILKAAELAVQADAMNVERRLRLLSAHDSGTQALDAVAAAIIIGGGAAPKLEIAAIDPQSTFDWVAIAVDALLHGWRDADSIDMDETRKVSIMDAEGQAFPATIDGESLILPSGTLITLNRHAANVLRARID